MRHLIHEKLLQTIRGKKAIIWDFDGVFCFADWHYGEDFNIWWDKLWKLLEEFDPNIRKKFQQLAYRYEHTDYIASHHGEKALERINRFYLEKEMQILPVSPINDELVSLIRSLDQTIEHYIWSNNQEAFISAALAKAGISDMFQTIVSRDKVALAKPNLHGFEIIRSFTSVPTKDFLFVGDSNNTDGVAAKKLGIDFFFYQTKTTD